MKLLADVNQKSGKHESKHAQLKVMGYELISAPLPVGDYVLVDERVSDVLERKKKRGIPVKKMDLLGSYKKAVDTKFAIQELIGDVCGKDHARFRDELILAKNNGIQLYILIEDDGGAVCKSKGIFNKPVRSIDDLFHWVNPRLFIWNMGVRAYPNATRGQVIAKALKTMEMEYAPVKFVFCSPKETGKKIVELLND